MPRPCVILPFSTLHLLAGAAKVMTAMHAATTPPQAENDDLQVH